MKKNTHHTMQRSSTNLPARAESGQEAATGDGVCMGLIAAGEKKGMPLTLDAGDLTNLYPKKGALITPDELISLKPRQRADAAALTISSTLPFWLTGDRIGQLGPDAKVRIGEKIASSDLPLCECFDCSPMNDGDGSLAGDPFRDNRRLDTQVSSQPNSPSSNCIEPFDKFFHVAIVRPSLINAIGIALKAATHEK